MSDPSVPTTQETHTYLIPVVSELVITEIRERIDEKLKILNHIHQQKDATTSDSKMQELKKQTDHNYGGYLALCDLHRDLYRMRPIQECVDYCDLVPKPLSVCGAIQPTNKK